MNSTRREVYEQQILRGLLAKMYLKDIALNVGLSETTVRKYVRGEAFRAELKAKYPLIYANLDAMLQEQADTISVILEENSLKALQKIGKLMDSDNEGIALKASQDALDRFTETSKVQKTESEHHLKIDPTLLLHAAATAKEVEEFKQQKALPEAPTGGLVQ